MASKKGKEGSECHPVILRLFRRVVHVHNLSLSIQLFFNFHVFLISLSAFHCSFLFHLHVFLLSYHAHCH